MIKEVEDILIEYLRKDLSEFISPEDIIIDKKEKSIHYNNIEKSIHYNNIDKKKSISLIITGFTVEEQGIGNSGGVKKEEVIEKFDADGKNKDFKLGQKPSHSPIIVENPIGILKNEPDDYTINYAGCKIFFRSAPKGDVQIKYYTDKTTAEIMDLKFVFTYNIEVDAEDLMERDRMALEIVKTFYRERPSLSNRGIDIKLIKGYPKETKLIIEYQVEITIQIDMPQPSIEKIAIEKTR